MTKLKLLSNYSSFQEDKEAAYDSSKIAANFLLPIVAAIIYLSICFIIKINRSYSGFTRVPRVVYYIPFIGSSLELINDPEKFFLKYFGRFSSPIFSAIIDGKKTYCIPPQHNLRLLYSTKQFDERTIVRQFFQRSLGATAEGAEETFDDVKFKPMNKIFHHNLTTETELDGLGTKVQRDLKTGISIVFEPSNGKTSSEGWSPMELFSATNDVMFPATIRQMISEHIANPQCQALLESYLSRSGLLHSTAVPSFMFQEARRSRDRLVEIIMVPDFLKKGSKLIKEREAEFKRTHNMSREDVARFHLALAFASVANTLPTAFWTVYYLLYNEQAYKIVQGEVDAIMASKKEKGDQDEGCTTTSLSPTELDSMHSVRSVMMEAMRLRHNYFIIRDVTEDYTLKLEKKEYLLEKGSRIMTATALMHRDPLVFDNPHEFQWDRFMPDEKGKLPTFTRNGKRFDPLQFYGGGGHLCPGRKFAERQVISFVAILVSQYDLRLVNPNEPMAGNSKLHEGISFARPDKDVRILTRPRHQ